MYDLRLLSIEYLGEVGDYHKISADVNGEEIGYLIFKVRKDFSDIYLSNIFVKPQLQKNGIGFALYKKFGEVYDQNFYGMTITRTFVNPVAEYAFRKAVAEGFLPEATLNENYISRQYTDDEKNLAIDLRRKLPENVKGPVWAKNLRRKITASEEVTYDSINFEEISLGKEQLEENSYQEKFRINATEKESGTDLGYIEFEAVNDEGNKVIYISYIFVEEYARGMGISNFIFQKFAEIYNSRYSGWDISATFIDPAAQKAFNNTVQKGLLPQDVINTFDSVIPKNASVIQMFTTASPKINESDINYDVSESTIRDIHDNEQDAITINISYNGEWVGYLMFTVDSKKQKIFIENIEVWDVYQGLGFAQYMFKKFGEIYLDKYNNWDVGMEFQNPAAEAAFKKAIENGWIPQSAYNEDHIKRTY